MRDCIILVLGLAFCAVCVGCVVLTIYEYYFYKREGEIDKLRNELQKSIRIALLDK